MSAHIPSAVATGRRVPGPAAGSRLPWWAVVLPASAFAALLMLLACGGEAAAAEPAGPLPQLLLTQIRIVLSGL
ncbi:hypothetical protein [Streptomyces aidingensis]|uniref:Uncharacterized protein n=1 Tax=Streptomyces aidingensis TaxID=910347 RepID=A0A1I1LYB8_9ACTN|nr:hypothetical protein [Streptomyces aidingensis]SFC78099.1 hypothetical protein SAMN05421773_10616 [Streptomyces aidingensis]